MSTMQIFHDQLIAEDNERPAYMNALAQLTQAARDQILAVKGIPGWEDWFAEAPQS